jgi:hypothetical protein
MARVRTLDEIIASVRERTNLENSEFVSDEELTDMINEEYAELFGRLTLGEGQAHFVTTDTISVVAGTVAYDLPDDFWKLLRLRASIDGIVRDMHPFTEGERAELENSQTFATFLTGGPRYRIQGPQVEILPSTRSFTATIRYIHAAPFLVAGDDEFDGFNGYEAAVIAGVCAMVREKEETDPSFFERRKDRIYRLIDAHAAQRDASHPERVTDVTGGLSGPLDWWVP